MSNMGTHVKVVKAGDKGASSTANIAAAPTQRVEPEAQLVEAEPGAYDITFTCSCGEKTVIRCYSLEKPSKPAPTPPPPAAVKPSTPPAPAKPEPAAAAKPPATEVPKTASPSTPPAEPVATKTA